MLVSGTLSVRRQPLTERATAEVKPALVLAHGASCLDPDRECRSRVLPSFPPVACSEKSERKCVCEREREIEREREREREREGGGGGGGGEREGGREGERE
jgi:hypothetical protein